MVGFRWCATRPSTSRRTSRPSNACTFRRSRNAVAGATPASSWPRDRIRPSSYAVVSGLPKSWHTAPSMMAICRGRSSPAASSSRARLVDDEERVRPHVAFGVPLGLLRAAHERRHLGPEPRDDVEVPREGEAERRPARAEQELLELAPDALGGQVVERDPAAQRARAVVHRELEPRRELQRAEHAQAVVAEGARVHGAQDAARQVVAAAPRVQVLAGERVPEHRVDREVAPARGLRDRQVRVAGDLKALVPAPDLRLAAGERHVHAADLVDREALADRVDAAERLEQRAQGAGGHAVDLEVEVLRRASEERVAHPAAHDQGASALVAHPPGDGFDQLDRHVFQTASPEYRDRSPFPPSHPAAMIAKPRVVDWAHGSDHQVAARPRGHRLGQPVARRRRGRRGRDGPGGRPRAGGNRPRRPAGRGAARGARTSSACSRGGRRAGR